MSVLAMVEDEPKRQITEHEIEEFLAVKLHRDLCKIAATMSPVEARYLVKLYYAIQEHRVATGAQQRELVKTETPNEVVAWFADHFHGLETQIPPTLGEYAAAHVVGVWSQSIYGIGPVIAAGLLAHIDIEVAPTVGHIWRFAGLDPTVKWGKKEKRPWNADLKVLCWKAGESFKKFSNREDCFYGHIYRERKAREIAKNEALDFADQAAKSLEERNIKDKELRLCYESGKLPAGRLDLRATRYAVKLFLSHWHHVAYCAHFGEAPPKPYILTQEGGHAHYIAPPNWPMA